MDGLQWPCYDDAHPGEAFLHSRLWERPVGGPRAPFIVVVHELPVEGLDDEFPLRLTTGRRLAEYNTGVQTGGYASPTRRGETIDVSPEDAARLGFREGQPVRVRSRRGEVVAPGAHRPGAAPRPHLHDPAFPGRGRDQPPDDRCDRPEVGHGGVQGRGRSASRPWRRSYRWTFTSSDRIPPRRSERPSTRCWGHPAAAGRAARATPPAMAAPRAAAGRPPSSSGTCCCRRCTPCRTASAG